MLNMEYYATDELCAYNYNDTGIIVMDGNDNVPFTSRCLDPNDAFTIEDIADLLNEFIYWLYETFPVEITDEERVLLNLLYSQGYGWISRDRNGNLLISENHSDVDQYNFNVFDSLFRSIEADHSYHIPELLNL